MGIYDRQYYREERRGFSQILGESVIPTLIGINVAVAVLDLFTSAIPKSNGLGHWLTEQMSLPSTALSQPWQWWKLLAAGFAHESLSQNNGAMHVGLNMYGLWVFGRGVEARLGSREFLRLYLAMIVLANFLWLLIHAMFSHTGASLLGASGAVTGVAILYILYYPNQMFAFPPLPAWALGLLIIGMNLFGALGLGSDEHSNVAFSVHLAGAALAYAYHRSGMKLMHWEFRWPRPSRWFRPKLRVHREPQPADDLERRADRILEKMHEQGADSLSTEERRILSDYSRRMRQKHS